MRLLNVTQAAAFLEIDGDTLRRWADAGRIPSERTLGGHRRFDGALLACFKSGMRRESPLATPVPVARPKTIRNHTEAPVQPR
jgi:excisionase family DNA binding protein